MFIVNLIICDNLHLSTTNYRKTLIFLFYLLNAMDIYIKAVIRNIPDNGFLFISTGRCSDFYQISVWIMFPPLSSIGSSPNRL